MVLQIMEAKEKEKDEVEAVARKAATEARQVNVAKGIALSSLEKDIAIEATTARRITTIQALPREKASPKAEAKVEEIRRKEKEKPEDLHLVVLRVRQETCKGGANHPQEGRMFQHASFT